jgi:hypothetical protein
MTDHGVVAIDTDRLDAFADALLRVADEVLAARLFALRALDDAVAHAPPAVLDLGPLSARLRELGHDTRRRLDVVLRLPWDAFPSMLTGPGDPPPHRSLEAVRALVEADGRLRPRDASALLDRLVAFAGDPYEAAAALDALGVDGFRHLYEIADIAVTSAPADERDAATEDRYEQVTALLLAASRTVDHPGGLSRRFVDDLFPIEVPDDDGLRLADVSGPASNLFTAADAGHYLASTVDRAVRTGAATVFARAGRVIAIGGLAAGVVDGLANGDAGTVVETVVTTGLQVLAAAVGGPVGWAAAGMVLLTSAVRAIGAQPGRPPPAPTRATAGPRAATARTRGSTAPASRSPPARREIPTGGCRRAVRRVAPCRWRRSPSPSGRGSRRPSARRRRRRPRGGRRSPPGSTPSSSPRPARARRSPPSCGGSTG